MELAERSRFLGCVRDISAQKRAEDALEVKRQQFEAVFENTLDAIVVVQVNGEICEVNKMTCVMFGYQRSELVGANVALLTPPEHRDKHQSYIDNYLRTKVEKVWFCF